MLHVEKIGGFLMYQEHHCRRQGSAAAAFRNTMGMFDYKQQYNLNTFKWQYHYYVGCMGRPISKRILSHIFSKVSSRASI